MENNYFVEETFKTPRIKGDISAGVVEIVGKSLPEDAKSFYRPFREWFQKFYTSDIENIRAIIQLEYYNTATSKVLINILLKLNELKEHKNVTIEWRYDEDDLEMEETGMDFKNLIGDIFIMNAVSE